MTDQTPIIGEPVPSNDRGFLLYGGREIPTDYGHTVRVQESSAAEGPHVWLFISDSPQTKKNNPHLNLEQAVAVHAALGQFIDGVAERWGDGPELLAEAKQRALGASVDVYRASVLRDFLWRLEQSSGHDAAAKLVEENPEWAELLSATESTT